MTKQYPKTKIVIDLTGAEGNAFAMLGKAKRFSIMCGLDPKPIIKEMKSGDYDHLVNVMDKYFGHFVVFEKDEIAENDQ